MAELLGSMLNFYRYPLSGSGEAIRAFSDKLQKIQAKLELVELSKQRSRAERRVPVIDYILDATGFIPDIGTKISAGTFIYDLMSEAIRKLKLKNMDSRLANGSFESVEDEVFLLDKLGRVARLQSK